MRTKDMRRSVAALAALVVVGGCTGQVVDVHSGRRQPVRVDVTATPGATPKQDGGDDGGTDGGTGDGNGGDPKAPTAAPTAPAAV
ncbi:murein L,D-transpeptidase, partial [Streptomyces ipomoeae]|nr:murein L,D-transpeptidase [Streptomyces ipomoeae]